MTSYGWECCQCEEVARFSDLAAMTRHDERHRANHVAREEDQ